MLALLVMSRNFGFFLLAATNVPWALSWIAPPIGAFWAPAGMQAGVGVGVGVCLFVAVGVGVGTGGEPLQITIEVKEKGTGGG